MRTTLAYWAMARELKSIELHDREQVDTPDDPGPCELPSTFDQLDSKIVNHDIGRPKLTDVMSAAKWPTSSPQSAQFADDSSQ